MPLPEIIEILPLDQAVEALVNVPGSKSVTNRALISAALGEGETVLHGALWSEDTQVMVECLQELGFMINIQPEAGEPANRLITVYGKGGLVPNGGTRARPLELFVANAGTAARFLAAFVCLGRGAYLLDGVPRMRERPQAALFMALRELGYLVETENDRLPAIIWGAGPRVGRCHVSIAESSQFASALLLCARAGHWQIDIEGQESEEAPYVAMTSKLIEAFPGTAGSFQIEPDTSSGSYFWGAEKVMPPGSRVRVAHWPLSGWQPDQNFPAVLERVLNSPTISRVSRQTELGDSIMTAMVLAPFAQSPALFTDLGRLRVQECERVQAVRTELVKCGAEVQEQGDTLLISPGKLHAAEFETYNDHRMAMCLGLLGLRVAGVRLRNPSCVKKTFPNFFQKLSALPPAGLGARIRDVKTGKELSGEDLFAA